MTGAGEVDAADCGTAHDRAMTEYVSPSPEQEAKLRELAAGDFARQDDDGLWWVPSGYRYSWETPRVLWFDEIPPVEATKDVCLDCDEWQPYPPGQEHFGMQWVQTCRSVEGGMIRDSSDWEAFKNGCKFGHAHHDDEVWLA